LGYSLQMQVIPAAWPTALSDYSGDAPGVLSLAIRQVTMVLLPALELAGNVAAETDPETVLPIEKLESMDGEVVSAGECSAMAEALAQVLASESERAFLWDVLDLARGEEPPVLELLDHFCAFLRIASEHGGFRVT